MTTRQVAELLKCTPKHVRDLCELGEIKGQKSKFRSKRSHWRITEKALDEYALGEGLREGK